VAGLATADADDDTAEAEAEAEAAGLVAAVMRWGGVAQRFAAAGREAFSRAAAPALWMRQVRPALPSSSCTPCPYTHARTHARTWRHTQTHKHANTHMS
jgi:hypothetical protein